MPNIDNPMNKSLHLLFIFLLTAVLKSYCQDTVLKYTRPVVTSFTIKRYQITSDYLHHRPDENDEGNVKIYGYLSNRRPDSNNYEKYYSLACSLWDLNKLEEAKKMFLTIINSKEKYYLASSYHSSDIPDNTTSNIYGYGSYSSNYKSHAALYLTKIYIEQRQFDKAFSFLEMATKKYEVSYSCGTGYRRQQDEYDFLYACIYEGQKKYDKVMKLLLPACLTRDDKIIVRTIKALYSEGEIKEKLQQAEKSMQCKFDSVPSYSYSGYSGAVDTLEYYSGTATMNLFDVAVTIPRPHLENGERITKEYFLKEFRESRFYRSLK
ncbi:hypothetical protein L3C95_11820 [Chitinophaga filiformis]|uniref:tetratricopeptide repeat protein n=1 Tax=Chitinophaga filiformis TaxID=104663 RepID=UPI001F3C925D|nr:hypothetical protein [Chitinophaga filiformis]MCF6403568.1 hypothetical protein [Chitinophaga filiformis]